MYLWVESGDRFLQPWLRSEIDAVWIFCAKKSLQSDMKAFAKIVPKWVEMPKSKN